MSASPVRIFPTRPSKTSALYSSSRDSILNLASLRLLDISLSTVTTRKSVQVVSSSSFSVIASLITSLSAPESIIAFTMMEAPEDALTMRTAMIGRMTLSLALTDALDVVAASHRTGSSCIMALLARGRGGVENDGLFVGLSNFRSWSIVACFLPHFAHVGR